MKKKKNFKNKKTDYKNQIIRRQVDEIEQLKLKISKLEISCEEKDKIIKSIENLRCFFNEEIENVKENGKKYDKLVKELTQMRTVMNQTVFKGRWKLIRFLMK